MLNLLKTVKRPPPPEVSRTLTAYKCGEKNQVCCPPGPITLGSDIEYHTRTEAPDVTKHRNYRILPQNCGFLDENIRKITGGEDAALNEYPWMALLRYRTAHGLEFLCGGTIINYNYILTAAHCLGLKDAQIVSVRVGEYSIKNDTDCEEENNPQRTLKCNPPVQDLEVEEIISHPQFLVKSSNIVNDIALLRVSKMRKDKNVYPICLPTGEIRDWPYKNVFVSGWGLVNSQTRERADILQKVSLPITDKQTCSSIYSERGIELFPTQICAGGVEGKGTCSGDSGGPMMVPAFVDGNFLHVQHGIVSVGPSFCGIKGYPSVYTMVKFYMDWILDHMRL